MAGQESAVYCTLLLSDNYLPGAVVLAHSLRDNGTQAKLAALYTPETLQAATIRELQTVYDVLIPVYRTTNHTPANLWLMERPDLIATFTKVELWRQTQFKRIVYIDCDVVAVRAPDELLELDVDFAAAPDVGWPDCFNSGVMVLRPNMQDYYALKALADRGISFDGADQGLLNMHFRNWHRLSFTYNCTPSANYQYIPAYKHFQSTISLIHFIGSRKPWNMPRQVAPFDSPYNHLLGRWWTIYDRHYRAVAIEQTKRWNSRPTTPQHQRTESPVPETAPVPRTLSVKSFAEPTQRKHITETTLVPSSGTQLQAYPAPPSDPGIVPRSEHHGREEATHEVTQIPHPHKSAKVPSSTEQPPQHVQVEHHKEQHVPEPVISVVPQYVRGEEHVQAYVQPQPSRRDAPHPPQPLSAQEPGMHAAHARPSGGSYSHTHHQPTAIVKTQSATPHPSAQPPAEPEPEPEAQPVFEAPKAEWDASREPPPLNSKPEGIALEKKTYTMSEDHQLFKPPASYPEAPKNMYYQVPSTRPEPQRITQIFPWEKDAPKPTRVFENEENQRPESPIPSKSSPESAREESRGSQVSQTTSWTSEVLSAPSESWETYSRSNAWDEIPEIRQYIQSIQQARKGRVQVISGGPTQQTAPYPSSTPSIQHPTGWVRVTDFPSEIERPSLPVTPAPIPRPPGSPGDSITDQLPAAEGVPKQEEWNPSVRLEELRRRQSEVLDNSDPILERLSKAVSESPPDEGRYG